MNYYIVLKSVIGLAVLWYFVFYLWRDYRLDSFREHLFSIRDRMFMYAAEGNIGFDHPAYTITRARANSLIRHAHQLTLTRFVVVMRTQPTIYEKKAREQWERMIDDLPPDVQGKMREFRLCISVAALQHIAYLSFFRYVVVRPLTLIKDPFKVSELRDHPRVVLTVDRIENDAAEQELLQQEAAHAHA
jgi:hypothetical protein